MGVPSLEVQRVVCSPAIRARPYAFASSRSSIRPCKQVGKHHGGAGGCLTLGDSSGIRGVATHAGGELGGGVLQPLASSVGASAKLLSQKVCTVCVG